MRLECPGGPRVCLGAVTAGRRGHHGRHPSGARPVQSGLPGPGVANPVREA
jgi:hypothetical protein